MDAENINDVFAENEVDGIYLNFSDPLAKGQTRKEEAHFKTVFLQDTKSS